MAKYWWGSQGSSRKIHWCQWSSLCQPKEAGGLGFQDLMAFNKALLVKQGWRLLSNTHSLFFRTFKSKYFPKSSFLLAQLGSNPSFVWRSFLAARELLTEGVRWKMGSGSMVEVWNDRWTPHIRYLEVGSSEVQYVAKVDRVFEAHNAALVKQTPIHLGQGRDKVQWIHDKKGEFSVRFTYNVAVRIAHGSYGEEASNALDLRRFWSKL